MKSWWRKLWPRKLLEWREPKEFGRLLRLSRERARSKSSRLKWATLFFAMLIGPYLGKWAVGDEPHSLPLWAAFIVAAGFAWLVIYVLIPWLERLPTTVTMWEPYLARSQGNALRVWRYADIRRCSWIHRPDFSVLVLHLRKGRDVFIGVPAGDTTAKADALLRERSLAPQVDDTGLAHHLLGASNK